MVLHDECVSPNAAPKKILAERLSSFYFSETKVPKAKRKEMVQDEINLQLTLKLLISNPRYRETINQKR